MAKKKQAEQELSLFDDSFFDNTPVSQEEILRTGYLDDIRQPLELPERKQAFHTALDKIEEELKQLDSDEWLTVPVTVKDKYKILRVISSLTHEPFDVNINRIGINCTYPYPFIYFKVYFLQNLGKSRIFAIAKKL